MRQARTEPIDELRAKDLLRQRAIEPRTILGQWTVGWLSKRQVRRPAGCSARLFKAMNTEDPFTPPPDHLEPGPRPLYVADRFVRIDKAAKASAPGAKVEAKKKVPAWMEAMQRQREEDAARNKEQAAKGKPDPAKAKAAKDKAAKGKAAKDKGPAMAHTPAFGAAPTPNVDRTPPRHDGPPGSTRPGAARPKARLVAQAPSRPPPAETVPRTDAGALDRTPPRIAPSQPPPSTRPVARQAQPASSGPQDGRPRVPAPTPATRSQLRPQAPAPRPAAPAKAATRPNKPVNPLVDRTPPRVAHAPRDSQGAPLRTNAEIQKARKAASGVLGGVGANSTSAPTPQAPPKPIQRPPPPPQVTEAPKPAPPPSAAQPAPAPAAPPPPRAPSAGGMDDLFGGGPMEGRARIAPRVKKTVEAAPEEAKPAPAGVDRSPPLLRDAAPPKGEPGPMVPAPPPAQIASAASKAPTPPPAPPKPAPPPSGGLDDLFGGPTEGRPKMAPRLKKTVSAAPEEPAPAPAAPAIDRAPPLIQDVDPKKLPK